MHDAKPMKTLELHYPMMQFLTNAHTTVSRKVVQQNRAQQNQKVLWVVGVPGL